MDAVAPPAACPRSRRDPAARAGALAEGPPGYLPALSGFKTARQRAAMSHGQRAADRLHPAGDAIGRGGGKTPRITVERPERANTDRSTGTGPTRVRPVLFAFARRGDGCRTSAGMRWRSTRRATRCSRPCSASRWSGRPWSRARATPAWLSTARGTSRPWRRKAASAQDRAGYDGGGPGGARGPHPPGGRRGAVRGRPGELLAPRPPAHRRRPGAGTRGRRAGQGRAGTGDGFGRGFASAISRIARVLEHFHTIEGEFRAAPAPRGDPRSTDDAFRGGPPAGRAGAGAVWTQGEEGSMSTAVAAGPANASRRRRPRWPRPRRGTATAPRGSPTPTRR